MSDDTRRCAACLKPLVGRQMNATLCASNKCVNWAARHPGVLHPSASPRFCAWCGASIDHRNGKAKYCNQHCITSAWTHNNNAQLNKWRRVRWTEAGSTRKQSQQAYRKANVNKYRKYQRDSRLKNPERYKSYYRQWIADPANYELTVLNGHKRRVRERQNPGSVGVSVRDWVRLVNRYKSCCAYCGIFVERPVIEHVIPLARGGRHAIGNVLPACSKCNASKHALFIMEWRNRRQNENSGSSAPLSATTLRRS